MCKKPEGECALVRHKYRWEDNVKIIPEEDEMRLSELDLFDS
jgi:hypothetical protein